MNPAQDEPPGDGPLALPHQSRGPVAEGVTWQAKHVVLGFATVLALYFLLSTVLIFPISETYGLEAPETLAAQAIVVGVWDLLMVAIVYGLVRSTGGSWGSLGFRIGRLAAAGRDGGPRAAGVPLFWFLRQIGGSYALAYGTVLAYSLGVSALGLEYLEPQEQVPDEFFDHDWLLPLLGVSVVLLAPLAEEVFFRGFLFAGLRRYMAFLPAAALSSVVFAAAHAQSGLIIPFTLVGVILAATYERTSLLPASIGVHFLFNFVSFMLLVVTR